MRVLLTGASGFVGTALQKEINCAPLTLGSKAVDLRNVSQLEQAISEIRPDVVIHLAAQSFVPQSFVDPFETFHINFLGTLNLLQALKKHQFRGRFLFVSSGDVYGAVRPELLPIKEDLSLRPRSPYGVSKAAAEALCVQWSQTEKMEIVIARPFNHIGPGQSDRFVVSSLAKQIVAAKRRAEKPTFLVGDIQVTRDFTDVQDVVRAYLLLIKTGENGAAYNICSGIERSIRSVLMELLTLASTDADIQEDRDRLRDTEQKRLVGDAEKIRMRTGWHPTIPFQETLASVLTYWENVL